MKGGHDNEEQKILICYGSRTTAWCEQVNYVQVSAGRKHCRC